MANSKEKAESRKDSAPEIRADNLVNELTGVGLAGTDSRQSTRFLPSRHLSVQALTDLYRYNGLTKRMINLRANDMTRNWFKVNGDDKDVITQKLETLEAQVAYKEALIWAAVYGGAVIFMGLDDGGDIATPVNENRIKGVTYLRVYDRTMVQVDQNSISRTPRDPRFGQPTMYDIHPQTGGHPFRVHASRLIRFDGAKLPPRQLYAHAGWHDSIIQAVWEQVRQIGGVYDSTEFIVNDFIQSVFKVSNLQQMLAAGNEGKLKQRMELLDMSKSIASSVIIGEGETFEKHASSVAGLDTVLDRFMMAVSSVYGAPVTILFGRSPAGQNATGDADFRSWYDNVHSEQMVELRPRLEPLIRYCFLAAGGEPETWSVEFNPLWTPTPKEAAEVYRLNTEADVMLIDTGQVSPAAMAKYRLGGESYNAAPPTIAQDDLDEAEAEAAWTAEANAALQAEAEAARKEAEAALKTPTAE